MNSDPTEAEWLRSSAGMIKDHGARDMALAQVAVFEATEAMNKANLKAMFTQISSHIQGQLLREKDVYAK
jgi:hypothetical protein